MDFKNIGAKWMDELRPRQKINAPGQLTVHVAQTTNRIHNDSRLDSKELLDRITARVNSANGNSNAKELNDFFKGFDLVAEDLSRRL